MATREEYAAALERARAANDSAAVRALEQALQSMPKGMSAGRIARGVGEAALQGVTAGWGDEVIAAGRAGLDAAQGYPFGESYSRNLADQQEDRETFRKAYPKAAIVSEMAGGIGLGGGLAGGVRALATKAPRAAAAVAANVPKWAQYAALGSAEGAAYGSGQTADNRAAGAAVGALVGAGTSAGVSLGAAGVHRAYNAILKPMFQRLASTPPRDAQRLVATALAKSNLTPEQARQAIVEMGDDGMLMHLSPYLEDLAYQAQAGSGPGRTIINEAIDRVQSGQQGRILNAAGAGLGHADMARPFMEAVRNAKAEDAAPFYARAHAQNIRTNPQFEKLLKGVPSEAWQRAAKLARTEYYAGLDVPGLDRGGVVAQVRVSPTALPGPVGEAAEAGTALVAGSAKQHARGMVGELVDEADDGFSFNALPDVLKLDYVKRAWDDIIGGLHRSGEKQSARANVMLRNRILDFIDEQVPDFKKARGIWAGASQIEDAEKLGREIFTDQLDEIHTVIQRMGEGEKQAYRLGVSQAIRDRVEASGETHDALKRVVDTTANRKRIRAAFNNDEAFDAFMKKVKAEMIFTRLKRNVQGNSLTHARGVREGETGNIPMGKAEAVGMMLDGLRGAPPLANPQTNELVSRALVGRSVPQFAQPPQTPADRLKMQLMMPLMPFALNPNQ